MRHGILLEFGESPSQQAGRQKVSFSRRLAGLDLFYDF
jgi:hypothetical protein